MVGIRSEGFVFTKCKIPCRIFLPPPTDRPTTASTSLPASPSGNASGNAPHTRRAHPVCRDFATVFVAATASRQAPLRSHAAPRGEESYLRIRAVRRRLLSPLHPERLFLFVLSISWAFLFFFLTGPCFGRGVLLWLRCGILRAFNGADRTGLEWNGRRGGFFFPFGRVVLYYILLFFIFLLIPVTNWVHSFVIFILSFVLWGKIVYIAKDAISNKIKFSKLNNTPVPAFTCVGGGRRRKV